MVSAKLNKVIKTGDRRYDVYVEINYKDKLYELYLPKLSKKPSEVKLEVSGDRLHLKLVSRDEGICSCELDLKDIEKGCVMLSCKPTAVWISDTELIKSHRVYPLELT